jgi:hypothetical protein
MATASAALVSALRRAWRALRGRPATPIEVLVVDRARRRTVERQLRAGLRRLERLLPAGSPQRLVVVVQQTIEEDRPVAGCVQVARQPNGTGCAVVRLALQVDGRRLTPDELLAALCDRWLALALGHTAGGVPVPVAPRPTPPAGPAPLAAFRPDPLVSQANGPAPTAPRREADSPPADHS